jgi:hypothetical protein
MKLRRDVAVTPRRTGEEAWAEIVGLVTGSGSVDKRQLDDASSVMATLLAEEVHADHPLTLTGAGPRIVIYCAYGADALTLEPPDTLRENPTAGEWTLYVPCPDEHLAWCTDVLAERASRVRLHALNETPVDLAEVETEPAAKFAVDWGAVRR